MAKEAGFKRKCLDFDLVADDFSDFSLSSPALKIRRLDAESLPPMMDEDGSPATYDHSATFPEDGAAAAPVVEMGESVPPTQSENLERALVLFRPVNILPTSCSQSNYSVALDSQLLSCLNRDQLLSSGQAFEIESGGSQISDASDRDGCRAVVPWVSQHSIMQGFPTESMEPDEAGVVSMDVEDSEDNGNIEQGRQFCNSSVPQLQQQQHCLIPELPRNNLTPVTWLR
ncbi:hypothetical protein LINPERPRIM_LOCUS22247 [Linum perenne]